MENILLQPKDLIKQRRETLGLTQKEFACLLNLKESGDRTISGWERGEHAPTEAKLKIIENLSTFIPFKKSSAKSDFTFIDLPSIFTGRVEKRFRRYPRDYVF